jgi:hypothetical protein
VAEALGKANAPDPLIEHGILPALLLERGGAPADVLEGVLSGANHRHFRLGRAQPALTACWPRA